MKKLVLIAVLGTFGAMSYGQQEYSFTHFADAMSFFNPGATGSEFNQKVGVLFRKQWTNFNGSPINGGIIYDQRLNNYNMGLGGYVFTDQIGAMNMTNAVVNYAYSLKLDGKHYLGMGMDLGADFISVDYSRLVYWDESDAMFTGQPGSAVVPRVGVGFQFYSNDYFVGISMPRALTYHDKHNVTIDKNAIPSLVSHYYITGGYKFGMGENITGRATALMKYTPNVKPQGDINFTSTYKEMIGIGLGYKSLGFASINVAYTYKNLLTVGYAFDITTTPIRNYSNGSHEVMLKYVFPKKQVGTERFSK